MSKLHMYSSDCDTVIAESIEDAYAVIEEYTELDAEEYGDEFKVIADGEFFYLGFDEPPTEKEIPEGAVIEKAHGYDWGWHAKATVHDWIEFSGRGFFASTEH